MKLNLLTNRTFAELKVAVLGYGVSGKGVAKVLAELGISYFVFDEAKQGETGFLSLRDAEEIPFDFAVTSPGIPLDSALVQFFVQRGIPVVGEIEFAYLVSDGSFVCITGTNGKTTTTTLCGAILSRFQDTRVVGNIGISATANAYGYGGTLVTEISSFQLETLRHFRADISAILNITADHLDRHKTFEQYRALKLGMFDYSTVKVFNADDAVLLDALKGMTEAYGFSTKHRLQRGAFVQGGKIFVDTSSPVFQMVAENLNAQYVCDVADIQLVGLHNVENVLAAVLITRLRGVPVDVIASAIRTFTGVEHRIEFVREWNGIKFYNDSKGTNPDSTIKAIEAMADPIHLIAGGYEKNSDFSEMLKIGKGRIQTLSLMGTTAKRFRDAALAEGYPESAITIVPDMKHAVENAYRNAKKGEVVLLSPASASWDMYPSFEVRGTDFKENVHAIS